ncbi:MAG: 4-hydroxythreonine-4-phosphate dehydrogenase PdxA [Planctomycetaceae bacterium]
MKNSSEQASTQSLPVIALTMGDVAGIGPEVIARVVTLPDVLDCCQPLVVGHPEILARAFTLIKSETNIQELSTQSLSRLRESAETAFNRSTVLCWNPSGDDVLDVTPGKIDARAGRAAHDYLLAAAEAALKGDIDAITTAPLNKAALNLAGIDVPGHTEILARVCKVDSFAMMLYLPPGEFVRGDNGLAIAHVTLHTSIASVPRLLTTAGVQEKIHLVNDFLKKIGCSEPRIGVCALNPHAGEEGLFGDEESQKIEPAIRSTCELGVQASGPFPADTLIRRAMHGEFDGLVAMYHDQGHIPFKLVGFDRAMNITLGLPIVRTSPTHGTAFDIAWTGQTDCQGMQEAIRIAARLSKVVE